MKKNYGRECLRRNAKAGLCVSGVGNEARTPQKIEASYCDLVLKKVVTVFESREDRNWRTVPVGWE